MLSIDQQASISQSVSEFSCIRIGHKVIVSKHLLTLLRSPPTSVCSSMLKECSGQIFGQSFSTSPINSFKEMAFSRKTIASYRRLNMSHCLLLWSWLRFFRCPRIFLFLLNVLNKEREVNAKTN